METTDKSRGNRKIEITHLKIEGPHAIRHGVMTYKFGNHGFPMGWGREVSGGYDSLYNFKAGARKFGKFRLTTIWSRTLKAPGPEIWNSGNRNTHFGG